LELRYFLSPKLQRDRRLASIGKQRLNWILDNSPSGILFSTQIKDYVFQNFRSQLGQDVLALSVTGPERKGFFVEFGATNGIDLSNTHLLETGFGWTGILSEPARRWHKTLDKNRMSSIDKRCVYSSSGERLEFLETKVPELSTLSTFGSLDEHASARSTGKSYSVETVSLMDLLAFHDAPARIDFLSIDTEGSEFEILNAFDFSKYSFGLICVEHNFTQNRTKIYELLAGHGYRRVHENLSDFDDWYISDQG
jgi:FkbM family methyltransferase